MGKNIEKRNRERAKGGLEIRVGKNMEKSKRGEGE